HRDLEHLAGTLFPYPHLQTDLGERIPLPPQPDNLPFSVREVFHAEVAVELHVVEAVPYGIRSRGHIQEFQRPLSLRQPPIRTVDDASDDAAYVVVACRDRRG